MSLGFELQESREDGFPRVSRDEPFAQNWCQGGATFFPRERG